MTALHPVLYQLYMIPAFRKGIMGLPEAELQSPDKLNNLPYQLKKIFEAFDSDLLPDTKSFLFAYKDFQGKPSYPLKTIDAVEFLHTFFDQLDNALKALGKNHILNDPFRGKILHEIHSQGCSHIASRPEDFYTIPLTTRHKKGLEGALTEFFQEEVLTEYNQYFCGQCQKKVDAIKKAYLSEVPNHLCFTLKRFELDYETFETVLLKDYFEIPDVIDLRPSTHEALSEKTKEEEQKNLLVEKNFRYCLGGAVVYSGSCTNSGFYYSLVRDREDGEVWYKMGPKGKEKFDFKDFAEEAFGGGEEEDSKKSNGFAYMVFYDKIESQEHHFYEKEP